MYPKYPSRHWGDNKTGASKGIRNRIRQRPCTAQHDTHELLTVAHMAQKGDKGPSREVRQKDDEDLLRKGQRLVWVQYTKDKKNALWPSVQLDKSEVRKGSLFCE
jgi:hypothetical protein